MKQLIIIVPGSPMAKKRHQTVPLQQCLTCHKTTQGMYRDCQYCHGPLRFIKNMEYSHSESVKYENLISFCAQQAMKAQGIEQFTGPTRMRMTFLFPVPVSRACKKHGLPGQILEVAPPLSPSEVMENYKDEVSACKRLHPGDPHTQRPDVDNCVKSALDGLNGVAFADDCIIVEMTARKQWGSEGKAEIIVEEL